MRFRIGNYLLSPSPQMYFEYFQLLDMAHMGCNRAEGRISCVCVCVSATVGLRLFANTKPGAIVRAVFGCVCVHPGSERRHVRKCERRVARMGVEFTNNACPMYCLPQHNSNYNTHTNVRQTRNTANNAFAPFDSIRWNAYYIKGRYEITHTNTHRHTA